jgi:hypothetical protein
MSIQSSKGPEPILSEVKECLVTEGAVLPPVRHRNPQSAVERDGSG